MSSDISPSLSRMDLQDEENSPWGDEPSRSHSSRDLTKAGDPNNLNEEESPSNAKPIPAARPSSPTMRSPSGRGPRTPRRVGAQTTRLESVDDTLGPLGPLGDADGAATSPVPPEQPPAPPQKEQQHNRSVQPPSASQSTLIGSTLGSPDAAEKYDTAAKARAPPSVHPRTSQSGRQSQPSMSVEQAANPKFDILVGDPHKVGDLTSSHIVYQVRTKTTSKAYRESEFAVTRRYRDFLWLYNQLHNNNPGLIVPPPPEKQVVGRFDSNFVETRRAALERMLNKTAIHPILQHDGDLKLFLESEAFNVDVRHKERKEPGLGESKGMFGAMGFSVGSSGKFIEHDDWFHDRRIYLDALENQLKALLKAIDVVVKQRKELAEAAGDFSASLSSLAAVELSASLSSPLESLSDLQIRIQELYDRQAQQDVLTIGITIDEYIRLIGSVKQAFQQRQKAFHSWHAAESELQKRKATQDKLLRQGRSQQDRLNQLSADVADAERKVHQARLLFEDMGRLMRGELERFEREKVEDFKSGVETFLESAVEAQKELIELWETFLMQLDTEEDGQSFYKPPFIAPTAPLAENSDRSQRGPTDSKASPADTTEQED